MSSRSLLAASAFAALAALPASAGVAGPTTQRIAVSIENLAPQLGTFQTPLWIGFHDGSFDTYTGGIPVNGPNALVPNDALERLAEDGTTAVLSEEFLLSGAGVVDATVAGPNGPIAPGDRAVAAFLIDPFAPTSAYFSYASMVIPSNDAFVANGSPFAHPVFDASGDFVFEAFFVSGAEVNDAGTEVNDELPENTAFFGQMAPDTGVDENGVVFDHPGFLPVGSDGILDAAMFASADFIAPGFPLLRVAMRSAPAITDTLLLRGAASGAAEIPPVATPAVGGVAARLVAEGTLVELRLDSSDLVNVVAIHLHLGGPDENGPVVATLFQGEPASGPFPGIMEFSVETGDLQGPLDGFPLDALSAGLANNLIYLNVHTDDGLPGDDTGAGDFISGEIRAQLRLIN